MLPAFELIAAIVTSEAGDGGDHSMRQDDSTIRRYLRVARAHRMLLLLDIQPGYAPFLQEAKALERWLKEPDVGLALDPEWSMKPPLLPAQEIGSTDAATVNEVSRYLSGLVRRQRPAPEAAGRAPLHGRHDPERGRSWSATRASRWS